MQKTPFVWLGSKRARKRKVGGKGRLLDAAASAGLPVPAGAIILDECYQLLLREEVITSDGGAIKVPDPGFLFDTFYQAIRFPRMKNKVAVRPAFSTVNEAHSPIDHCFPPQLSVDLSDPLQLAGGLSSIWSAALEWQNDLPADSPALRRDLLIMEMVNVDVSGTAISRKDEIQDIVQISSATESSTLNLPRLRRWKSPSAGLPAHAQRIQRLLRGIRRTFGDKVWQVDWIDDGRICWILQLQPIREVNIKT